MDDLVELAKCSTGIEIVVHRVQKSLPVVLDFPEQWRAAMFEIGPTFRSLEPVEPSSGQLLEALEGAEERLQAAVDLIEPRRAVIDGPSIVAREQKRP